MGAIADLAKNIKGVIEVHSIRLRKLGHYMTGDMVLVVEGDMFVKEADEIATRSRRENKTRFEGVIDIKVRIESNIAHDRHSTDLEIKKEESKEK